MFILVYNNLSFGKNKIKKIKMENFFYYHVCVLFFKTQYPVLIINMNHFFNKGKALCLLILNDLLSLTLLKGLDSYKFYSFYSL